MMHRLLALTCGRPSRALLSASAIVTISAVLAGDGAALAYATLVGIAWAVVVVPVFLILLFTAAATGVAIPNASREDTHA